MSIKPRSGNWHYRFKIKREEFAKTTGLEATRQNYNAAKEIEARARIEARQGLKPTPTVGMPFDMAAEEFLSWCQHTEYRGKPNTWKRIRGSFSSLRDFFGTKAVRELIAGDIERYKTWRAEMGIKDCSIRNDLNALSLLLRYSVRSKWRDDNPLMGDEKVKRPSNEDAVRMRIITHDEESRYFDACRRRQNIHDLVKLLIMQGCRPAEVMSFEKANYKRADGTIKITRGKTPAARRTITLCGEAVAIIERRLLMGQVKNSKWLFPSDRIPGHHIVQMDHTHDSVLEDAGLLEEGPCLYDFRHTFATRMACDAKVDLVTLAAILGHSGLRLVQKYVHPTQEHQRAAMKQYEATRPVAKLKKVK